VSGDLTEPHLGLSTEDRQELQLNIKAIIHSAADVKFDRRLSEAFNINVEGTRNMLELATACKKLDVFLHVSTAYANCIKPHMEDRIYTEDEDMAKISAFTLSKMQEMESKPGFDQKKYLGKWPNTYCFTKVLQVSYESNYITLCLQGVAEQLVWKYSNCFPIAVVRPSIIVGAIRDPIPGWLEGFNGPTGKALQHTL